MYADIYHTSSCVCVCVCCYLKSPCCYYVCCLTVIVNHITYFFIKDNKCNISICLLLLKASTLIIPGTFVYFGLRVYLAVLWCNYANRNSHKSKINLSD